MYNCAWCVYVYTCYETIFPSFVIPCTSSTLCHLDLRISSRSILYPGYRNRNLIPIWQRGAWTIPRKVRPVDVYLFIYVWRDLIFRRIIFVVSARRMVLAKLSSRDRRSKRIVADASFIREGRRWVSLINRTEAAREKDPRTNFNIAVY